MTATPSPSLSPIYTDSSDGPFITVHDVLQQYSLPYGILGVVSHILIYYTLIVLGLGNRPFLPWRPLKHSKLNYFLSIISSTICVPVALFTIYRVHQLWCLVCLAVGQALTSLTLSMVTLHQAHILHRGDKPLKRTPFWWLVLHIVGLASGLAGMIGLLPYFHKTFKGTVVVAGGSPQNSIVGSAFFSIVWYAPMALGAAIAIPSIVLLVLRCMGRKYPNAWLSIFFGWLVIWSMTIDMYLALVSDNWVGSPDKAF